MKKDLTPHPHGHPGRQGEGHGPFPHGGKAHLAEEELLFRLRACGRFLRHHTEGRGSQRHILHILEDHQGMTQRELLNILGIQSGSLSEILGKIEGSGWIERTQNQEDKRNIDVVITQKGTEALRELDAQQAVAAKELFADLEEQEAAELSRLLDKLLDSWQKYRDDQRPRRGGKPRRREGREEE